MKCVQKGEYKKIIQYLKPDIQNCVYLYIDMLNMKHSDDENITVWYEESDDGVDMVLMKYYDSFQIYSRNDIHIPEDAIKVIMQYNVGMISGKDTLIKQLSPFLKRYSAEFGSVFRIDKYRDINTDYIQRATLEDIPEIAALICSNQSIGEHYTTGILEKQMMSRMLSDIGRSYIIRRNGEIIAHTATYAEAEGIAVISGTIIKEDVNDPACYFNLSNFIIKELSREGRQIYTFAINEKMVRYHRTVHSECATYGKMVLSK